MGYVLIQCSCSINALKCWARVTFRGGLHNGEKGNSDISKWRTQAAGLFESEEFKTTREEIMLYSG